MTGIRLALYKKISAPFSLFPDELEFRLNVSHNWRSDSNWKRIKIDRKKGTCYIMKYYSNNFFCMTPYN